MVPRVALPLAIPLIDHFTAVLPPAPFTAVRYWNVEPAVICAVGGITCTDTWPAAPTCTFMEVAESLLPGSGFSTVILTIPTCADVAVPVAVSWVRPTKVVVSGVPPNSTLEPLTKFEPPTWIEKLPTGRKVGLND